MSALEVLDISNNNLKENYMERVLYSLDAPNRYYMEN